MKFLLDTNALAEPVRPVPDAGFLRKLRAHETNLAIASVTLHESICGIERLPAGKRRQTLQAYLREVIAKLPVLPYDAQAAECHARERARLEAEGRRVPYADGQIAAIAVVNDVTLVTANVRDFRGIEGLRVEDWRG